MSAPASATDIAGRLARLRERIDAACARAGRDPAAVAIVAVSKGRPAAAVREAFAAGVAHFGENRVQEALPKIEAARAAGVDARWHFVGALQSNKARAAAAAFDAIHSVDSARLLARLDAVAPAPRDVFLQVNVSGEAEKGGVPPEWLGALVEAARASANLRPRGLMTIAPLSRDPEEARPVFRALRDLARRFDLPDLSMGMTNDLEAAVEEGATFVRVGRALFGEREP